MDGGRCNNIGRKRFSLLENGEVATCYSSWAKDNDEMISQSGKEFESSKLQQLVNKTVQQHPDSIQHNKVTGDCLKQQNEMIQEEVDSASCLLEIQIQRIEESIVENGKPETQVRELNKKLGELQETNFEEPIVENGKPNRQIHELNKRLGELEETNVKLAPEKEEQGKEFESLHAELAKKNRELEEKVIALLKENEEQRNMIESMQEISEEKIFLEKNNVELERRNSVLEEEEVQLSDRIGELEIALDSVTMDLEYNRQIAEKKEATLTDLQYQFSDVVKENICLAEFNNTLVTELNKCTMALEENVYLHQKIRELDISSYSLSTVLESKDILLQQLTSEHEQLKSEYQRCQSPVPEEYGEPNCVHEKTTIDDVHGIVSVRRQNQRGCLNPKILDSGQNGLHDY